MQVSVCGRKKFVQSKLKWMKKIKFVLYPSIFAVFTFLYFSLLSNLTGYRMADKCVVILEIFYVILGCFCFFTVKSNNIEFDDYGIGQLNNDSLFAKILDNLPVGMLILDEKGSIADVNKAASKIYGYSKNQLLINKTIVQLCPKWEENHIAYTFNRILMNRYKSVSENWQQVTANRKIIDLKVWIEPLAVGNTTIVMLAMADISTQKQMENELLLSLQIGENRKENWRPECIGIF